MGRTASCDRPLRGTIHHHRMPAPEALPGPGMVFHRTVLFIRVSERLSGRSFHKLSARCRRAKPTLPMTPPSTLASTAKSDGEGRSHRQSHAALPPHPLRGEGAIIARGQPSNDLFYIVNGSVTVLLEDERRSRDRPRLSQPGRLLRRDRFVQREPESDGALVRARTPCDMAHIGYAEV